ncbi:hypothetical protein N7470_010340 [Penicillium chermesinum]|nr:hypothetical protein N7470_010340 [Penicillium chermesinum]
MSEPHSAPVSLARYRPFLYLFTGVAAAYTLVYIRNHIISSSPSEPLLRRRGAINWNDKTVFMEHFVLRRMMAGEWKVDFYLLLGTPEQLVEEVGMLMEQAESMRETMEDAFLETFMALEFPPSHTLEEGSAERTYFIEQLQRRGISRSCIDRALARFNADENFGDDLRQRRNGTHRINIAGSTNHDGALLDAAAPDGGAQEAEQPLQTLDGGETVVDDQSVFSWRDSHNDASPTREGQNLLNLLYHIAEDQARRDGYIHRGVTCNSCGAMPIQGIRYRCANCIDYDLCETCEAMQVHIKTHLFYKVRIPAPFLGNPRQSQPVWYPGKPAMLPRSLPRPLAKKFSRETNFENTELDALWDQFRCLANYEWANDPNKLYMAIDRKTFDRCFVPHTSIRPPPPSLIYDRMFAFYDTNGDNLIGFEEFLKGLASLNNKSNDERLRRVFRGYDIDGDGYVERKDFLRIFRAYYALSRELTRDMIAGMEDDFLEGGARDVVLGSQPISSAFPGSIPSGDASRTGEGKRLNQDGDMQIIDNEGVLRQDSSDTADRHSIVGEAAVRHQFGRTRPLFPSTIRLANAEGGTQSSAQRADDEDEGNDEGDDPDASDGVWPPPEHISEEDIIDALGTYVPPQEINDPIDRARVVTAVYNRVRDEDQRRIDDARRNGIDERWRRRAFYTDEEDGATIPDGYQHDPSFDDLSDDDSDHSADSHPPSPRSRSSSKVRFQDDIPTDLDDIRSNPSTSSRSVTVSERWGGFEIPEMERDVGKEILYQVTQQGFNELLDLLFKQQEDLLMEVHRTRADRKTWAKEIEMVQASPPPKPELKEPVQAKDEEELEAITSERSLDDLLQRSGYAIASPTLPANEGPVLAPPSTQVFDSDDDVRPTHLPNVDDQEGLGQAYSYDIETESASETGSSDSDEEGSVESSDEEDADADFQEGPDITFESPDSNLEERPGYDPTMPQFRPENDTPRAVPVFHTEPQVWVEANYHDTEFLHCNPTSNLSSRLRLAPDDTPSLPAPSSPRSSSSEAEATAPKQPPSPMQPLPPPPKAVTSPEEISAPRKPSPQVLARWAYLNQVEREAKSRGGSGAKLNFEEFQRRMAADKGRRLAFVVTWIEMASF